MGFNAIKFDLDQANDPNKYDLIIALEPTVPWVADGMRELGDPAVRQQSFEQLMALYLP